MQLFTQKSEVQSVMFENLQTDDEPDVAGPPKFSSSFRIISPLEEAGVSHETHLFVEGENAPATDVAAVIQKVYKEVGADLLIASRSNKVIHSLS